VLDVATTSNKNLSCRYRRTDRTGCQWPWRLYKVDNFHFSWKGVCHFLLLINNNLGPITHRFRDMATYSLKLFTENCGQTAADGNIVTIDTLQEVIIVILINNRGFNTCWCLTPLLLSLPTAVYLGQRGLTPAGLPHTGSRQRHIRWYHQQPPTTYRLDTILPDWHTTVRYDPSRSSRVNDLHVI